MNCHEVQNQFDERLDGRLDDAARQRFEAHVAACAVCRKEWTDYAAAWEALRRVEPVTPSVGFVERTLRRLDEETERRLWPVAIRWLAYGTALVVLGLGSGLMWRQHAERERARLYAKIQGSDYLEDFDVVANLERLTANDKEAL